MRKPKVRDLRSLRRLPPSLVREATRHPIARLEPFSQTEVHSLYLPNRSKSHHQTALDRSQRVAPVGTPRAARLLVSDAVLRTPYWFPHSVEMFALPASAEKRILQSPLPVLVVGLSAVQYQGFAGAALRAMDGILP